MVATPLLGDKPEATRHTKPAKTPMPRANPCSFNFGFDEVRSRSARSPRATPPEAQDLHGFKLPDGEEIRRRAGTSYLTPEHHHRASLAEQSCAARRARTTARRPTALHRPQHRPPRAEIPERHGPPTTRWRTVPSAGPRTGVRDRTPEAISKAYDGDPQTTDSPPTRAHQHGHPTAKGGPKKRHPPPGTPPEPGCMGRSRGGLTPESMRSSTPTACPFCSS